jgi:hypothetical protein
MRLGSFHKVRKTLSAERSNLKARILMHDCGDSFNSKLLAKSDRFRSVAYGNTFTSSLNKASLQIITTQGLNYLYTNYTEFQDKTTETLFIYILFNDTISS